MPAAVTLQGGRGAPCAHPLRLETCCCWIYGRTGAIGVPRETQQGRRWELGLGRGPNPWGASLCASPPASPAPARALPLIAVSHAQHPLAATAWCGDASGPSPCLWTSPSPGVPVPWQTLGLDPAWGQTSLLLRAGGFRAGILATNLCPCPVPSPRGPVPPLCPLRALPQLAPGLQGGISLIFLNKRKYYLSLRARVSFCGRHPQG